jgi:hypothetical protein
LTFPLCFEFIASCSSSTCVDTRCPRGIILSCRSALVLAAINVADKSVIHRGVQEWCTTCVLCWGHHSTLTLGTEKFTAFGQTTGRQDPRTRRAQPSYHVHAVHGWHADGFSSSGFRVLSYVARCLYRACHRATGSVPFGQLTRRVERWRRLAGDNWWCIWVVPIARIRRR